MPTALVTGILGQDGSYLTEELLAEGYTVHGVVAPGTSGESSSASLHTLDLRDAEAVAALVAEVAPHQVYNLAGISSVATSWTEPMLTAEVNGVGALGLLEACWQLQEETGRPVRFVQASSAEMFGQANVSPQDEATPLAPVNPYGATKAFAHLATGVYRSRGLHASSLILYNHESPRRPPQFVTRKITSTVAAISKGEASELRLGNLDARRDWGWAPDYTHAMYLAARHDQPNDYVIATGESRTVREFVAAAFAHVGITSWKDLVVVDPAFFRPVDPADLRGNPTRAESELGWQRTLSFEDMVAAMVATDLP